MSATPILVGAGGAGTSRFSTKWKEPFMLVLTRREGRRIVMTHQGVTMTIEVLEARRGSSRLGISAPVTVEVLREELVDDAAAVAAREEQS